MICLALVLLLAGCSAAKPAFIWPWWRAGTAPIPREPWPTAAQEAELSTTAGSPASLRAGSSMMQAPTTEAGLAGAPSKVNGSTAGGPADAETMAEVLRELQSLDYLTPAQQQRLLSELKGHESSAWPQLVRNFRDSLPREPQVAPIVPQAPQGMITGVVATPSPSTPPTATAAPVATTVATAQPAASAVENPATPAQPQIVQVSATVPAPTIEPATTTPTPATAVPAAATLPAAPAAPAVLPANANVRSSPGDWQFHLAAAIGALEAQAATTTDAATAAADQSRLGLLYIAAGRRDDALRPVSAIAPEQQEFWSKELTGLAVYLEGVSAGQPAGRSAEAAAHLEAAQNALRERAELVVHNLAFCTEVTSYGVYQPFASTQFKPGQEVLLYAEIENLKSDHRTDGFYTALESSYEIVDAQAKSMDTRSFGVTQETCRNQRRDFFIRYQFFLPKTLADGAYTLKLQIKDSLGQKVGQATIQLSIKQ